MNRPNVLIVNHPSSYNLGNASLLYCTIDLVSEAINPKTITVWCLYPDDLERDLGIDGSVTLAPSPVRATSDWWDLLSMAADAALTAVWALLNRAFGRFSSFSRSTRTLAEADIIVVQGGDNIADTYGVKPLVTCLYGIWVPLIAKKKILLLSHTIGPFGGSFWRCLTMRLLAKADRIIVRDEYSLDSLQHDAGSRGYPPVVLLPDVAFLLPVLSRSIPFPARSDSDDDLLRVGVVPSSIISTYITDGTSVDDRHNRYVDIMVETIEYLVQSCGAQVVLIPHVQECMHNDLLVAERIYASVSDTSKVAILRDELDPRRVKSVISQLDFLITARMHPSIHSLSVGVPVVGINYNAKMMSLLNMFELDYLCIDLPQLDRQNFVERIDTLISELAAVKQKVAANGSRLVHREDYLNQIRIFWATAQRR